MKLSKAFFKKSEQRNVKVNVDYYTTRELENMYLDGTIFIMTKKGADVITADENPNRQDAYLMLTSDEYDVRMFLENVSEIKVVLDEYGYLATVAVVNGVEIFVEV